MSDQNWLSDDYCPAFVTSEQIDGPRTPISSERIVVVLGIDEETGLPLELSISLRRNGNGSISICAFREPLPKGPFREARTPWLIVENGPVKNERFVSVRYSQRPPPQKITA